MVYVVRLLFFAGMCDQWHVPDGCYVCTWVYERVVFSDIRLIVRVLGTLCLFILDSAYMGITWRIEIDVVLCKLGLG